MDAHSQAVVAQIIAQAAPADGHGIVGRLITGQQDGRPREERERVVGELFFQVDGFVTLKGLGGNILQREHGQYDGKNEKFLHTLIDGFQYLVDVDRNLLENGIPYL